MHLRLSEGQHLSFQAPVEWRDIPSFAVLTGQNGSGKTQLLSLIYRAAVTPSLQRQPGRVQPQTDGVVVSLEGMACPADEVMHLTSEWLIQDPHQSTIAAMAQQVRSLAQSVLDPKQNEPHIGALRSELEPQLELISDPQKLAVYIPPWAMLRGTRSPLAFISQLGLVFQMEHFKRNDLRLINKLDEEQIRAKRGAPPWEIANELMEASGLPYRLTSPVGLETLDSYQLNLIAQDTGAALPPSKLSSGEKILFGLIMSLFTINQYGILPRLLLLDEPDAHLHTSQIAGFLHMVRSKLVDEFKCRVIMTTHRPDTIALLKEEELFEVHRTAIPRITPARSKISALSRLTSQLIDILPGMRCVYVEDESDARFYRNVRDVLVREKKLVETPSLEFVPASLGKGSDKQGGGNNAVISSVQKLRSVGLAMVAGIVDGDNQPKRGLPDGVYSIQRYSFENYLYDPLVLYTALVDAKIPPIVPGFEPFTPGEEAKYSQLQASDLQKIVECTIQFIKKKVPGIGTQPDTLLRAELVHGQVLQVPQWTHTMRGHDLQNSVFSCFKQAAEREKLLSMLCRTRLIYKELQQLLEQIQRSNSASST